MVFINIYIYTTYTVYTKTRSDTTNNMIFGCILVCLKMRHS